ncbi:HupE/UreJ protein [Flavobacteriaceae bacterium MAR_2010_72]|nr:HupE/UreJ protein [Flavobacteriaceae bacterium MAR_2010_72]TVZ58496.1 HupE/UreJ protein [Flavobacteriaceae bacterium MAR_2010_105]
MLDDFLAHLQHGIYHVVNVNAYDHILFLIVLTLPYLFKDWKRVLYLVTIFTLGHTVSLALAAYNVVSINLKLIEFLIPLTILIIALYNVFTAGKKAQNENLGILFFTTLFFGLIHGLGFVSAFKSLIRASENKLIAILEISLGIEMGQLIIAFIVIFLGFLCQTLFRFSKRDWVMVISAVVVGLIIPMLISNHIFA